MRLTDADEFQWVTYQQGRFPELVLLYHIPNGGKRDAQTAISLKRQGVKAGVPDLHLPVARGGYHGNITKEYEL